MDLSGIGAIAAAGVAAVGIPAALLVGRWQLKGQLKGAEATQEASVRAAEEAARAGVAQAEATYRAALDAVQATAAANHDQWRRTVRRDAYVQLVLAATDVERLSLPENETVTTTEAVKAAEAAVHEALHRVDTAYYVVSLESRDLNDMALELVRSAQLYASGKRKWAAYLRAKSVLDENEASTRAVLSEVRDALGHLHELARASEVRRTPEVDSAKRDAELALSRVPQLSEQHIEDLVPCRSGRSSRPCTAVATSSSSPEGGSWWPPTTISTPQSERPLQEVVWGAYRDAERLMHHSTQYSGACWGDDGPVQPQLTTGGRDLRPPNRSTF
ncbi:hypothetical protein [Streptomyces sp. NPDC048425]|uniref:hypothetical protein n=1 Tax=Streptomyces sp. NPDC048425 TaxID=3365548 RepID=UPI0037209284